MFGSDMQRRSTRINQIRELVPNGYKNGRREIAIQIAKKEINVMDTFSKPDADRLEIIFIQIKFNKLEKRKEIQTMQKVTGALKLCTYGFSTLKCLYIVEFL